MSLAKTCSVASYMTDHHGVDKYWQCSNVAVDECCDAYYCDDCLKLHNEYDRHDCYCCENTGVVVNKVGLINIGQACVLCEGDV